MSTTTKKLLTSQLIRELGQKAAAAPRKRTNHNFHESLDDPVQRLVVAMKKGTYIRPHRHATENKWEFAVAIQGRMQIMLLNDDGSLRERIDLAPGGRTIGLEIPSEAWHTWLALDEDAVFFECKRGPYHPEKTNVFAPWSPPEGDPRVAEYSRWLVCAKIGERFAGL
ncbi:MAG: WbuC family cupin fold metalloprotein [Kiritimatiellae bacterium]|nr:WbuC family cupin fold metalloprotein [Kiritimatiellia bacterium]